MADNKDLRDEHILKEEFAFVQDEKRIFDKKFDTKPIGYFKDAMIRFTKNRGNVIASMILGIIILLSIFVPILSPKNAEILEEQVAYLPPRIPLLANMGIADGYKFKDEQQVDMSTIGTVEGLPSDWGLPATIDAKYIKIDTLKNYWDACTDNDELCIGGQNVLRLDSGSNYVAIETKHFNFSKIQNAYIEIDVYDMYGPEGTALNILMVDGWGEYKTVFSITEKGVYQINVFDYLTSNESYTDVRIEFYSTSKDSSATLESIKFYDDTSTSPKYNISGYDLSILDLVISEEDDAIQYKGNFTRSNGQRLWSSFKYDAYALAFGPLLENVFSKTEFEQIMAANSDVCVLPDESLGQSIVGWEFAEGCPIIKVINKTETVTVDKNDDGIITPDEEFYNYKLVLDYAKYKGYDEIPYYLFGTTAQGKDLFKMIWVGARTSLILGLIVSAINISVGIVFGAISGYYGGTVDLIMQRFSEIVGRIPWLVSLSIFTALVGPGQTTLILVLIINGWIGIASITRTQFYRYKGREYVLASRTLGAKDGRLIFRHILPNGIGTIITSAILSIPYVIFTESTLSYLGFGIGHGQSLSFFGLELTGASIGVLLNDGRNKMETDPYLTFWPAIVISVLMITFNMFGNALRDAFNPALRGSE